MTTDTAITALQHIAAGHDAVCTDCGWMGPVDQTMGQEDVQIPTYKCPLCVKGHLEFGANEIAAYALRQIEGGGE